MIGKGQSAALAATLIGAAALAMLSPPASGAGGIIADAAQIVASGTAEIRVPPTKASFTVGIVTEAPTAAQASADNARTYQAVDQALRRAHLGQPEIAGSRLTVNPRWDFDQATHRQRRAGFEANHTIEIATPKLDRLGAYLDAALGAGATSVTAIEFSIENPAAARHQALTEAVRNARGDAEAMARAAGGALGELLELGTEPGSIAPRMGMAEVMVAGARRTPSDGIDTSVFPSDIEVSARVVARWRFVAGR